VLISETLWIFILCVISLAVTVHYNYNYKVEEDEVGGTCGTNGGEEEHV
jgi:hypothetical protein